MHIFVDESGLFVPQGGAKSRFSCIAAIAVASDRVEPLYREYAALRAELFPDGAEPKGSALDEAKVKRFLRLLASYGAVLDACVIDAGIHHVSEIQEFQATQAEFLVADLDPTVQPEWYVNTMTQLSQQVAGLRPQLFTQCWAMVTLIHRLLQTLTLHFVFRQPRELGRFRWAVDPKDKKPTSYETAWSGLILPLITELTRREPIVFAAGKDYSWFTRFEKPAPAEALANPPAGKPCESTMVNVQAILEELSFPPSESCPGVQLADIAVNVLCRALNGNIKRKGWIELAPLMVRNWRGHSLRLLRMVGSSGKPLDPRVELHPRVEAIITELADSARWRFPAVKA